MAKKTNKMTEVMLTVGMLKKRPGDLVKVKPGYARNYLIPSGKAIRLKGNENKITQHLEVWKKMDLEAIALSEVQLEKLKDLTLEIRAQSGIGNSLYGSITAVKIAHILKTEHHIDISHRDVIVDPIKLLGNYRVKINLYGGHKTEIPVSVLPMV